MRNILVFLGILMAGALIWYLFIKPSDYLVTFQAKTFPGAIQQTVQLWNTTLDDAEIIDKNGIVKLTQRLQFGDSVHIYDWKITSINDSLSQVKVYAKDKNLSLKNKLAIPFYDTDFEKRTRKTLIDFNKKLNEHIDKFKVNIVGEEQLRSTDCACTTVSTTQFGKAQGMMKDYPLLNGILTNNNVKLNGRPFLEITKWNMETDSIQFNFCYPIVRSVILPQHPELIYKHLSAKKAIKAIYNGNYITSDRAWYAILDYAKKNSFKVTGLPIEVFHNNPNSGTNELDWKAEIYIPLKSSDE